MHDATSKNFPKPEDIKKEQEAGGVLKLQACFGIDKTMEFYNGCLKPNDS
ncbi:MAG: hypothetical protein ACYTF1_16630 [Planctomycetota bacterium]